MMMFVRKHVPLSIMHSNRRYLLLTLIKMQSGLQWKMHEKPVLTNISAFLCVMRQRFLFLRKKALPATAADIPVANDLRDTLTAHAHECVGMAANMIGVHKRIIVFDNDGTYMTMFNPQIIKAAGPYDTEESCLSLLGGPRPCKRYQTIKVQWQNAQFQTRIKTFVGWPAQIIQHEIDHCNGILI